MGNVAFKMTAMRQVGEISQVKEGELTKLFSRYGFQLITRGNPGILVYAKHTDQSLLAVTSSEISYSNQSGAVAIKDVLVSDIFTEIFRALQLDDQSRFAFEVGTREAVEGDTFSISKQNIVPRDTEWPGWVQCVGLRLVCEYRGSRGELKIEPFLADGSHFFVSMMFASVEKIAIAEFQHIMSEAYQDVFKYGLSYGRSLLSNA